MGAMLTKRKKQGVIKGSQLHEKDSGSPEVQIALLTKKIDELATHLKKHQKDNHSRRGLLQMVASRRSQLAYLQKKFPARYETFLKKTEKKRRGKS